MTPLKSALLHLAGQEAVYRFVVGHDLLRDFAWRYVAGETLADGIAITQALNLQGLNVTLDHLGENVLDTHGADGAVQAALDLLDAIDRERLAAYVSLKLTQLGLDLSFDLCLANLRRVLDRAQERGNTFVRIDMESSAYTQRTLDLHRALWDEGYRNVGVVLQAYLYRSAEDLERLLEMGARVRLCKGAYLEPAAVAWPNKRAVDANYARLAERLLLAGDYPAIATHDERLIRVAQDVARHHRIAPERFEFQMLYGVRRDLQARLRLQGYNVRVYLPYGTQWYPYLARRLAERPANLGFFVRSFLGEALARPDRAGGAVGRDGYGS